MSSFVMADTVLGIVEKRVWECFSVLGRENGSIRIRLMADADNVTTFGTIDNFIVIPRTPVGPHRLLIIASKKVWYLLNIQMLNELWKRIALCDYDGISSFLINPPLNNGPNLPKNPGSINNKVPCKLFWIILITSLGCFLNDTINSSIHHRYAKAIQI